METCRTSKSWSKTNRPGQRLLGLYQGIPLTERSSQYAPPDSVRNELNNLSERGWIDVLRVGQANGPAYWFLTGSGHEELARYRRVS